MVTTEETVTIEEIRLKHFENLAAEFVYHYEAFGVQDFSHLMIEHFYKEFKFAAGK